MIDLTWNEYMPPDTIVSYVVQNLCPQSMLNKPAIKWTKSYKLASALLLSACSADDACI